MAGTSSQRITLVFAGMIGMIAAGPAAFGQDPFKPPASDDKAGSSSDAKGPAKEPERIFRSNEEWRQRLTTEQFMVTRMKATEPAFSGKYASGHYRGTFVCVCCGAKLFDAATKFESGTGWPSFWKPISPKAVDTAMDYSEPSEARVEVNCHRCGAHLGHVFDDGPPPTGLRYCMNSTALSLDTDKSASTSTRRSSRTPSARSTKKNRASTATAASARKQGTKDQADEPKS